MQYPTVSVSELEPGSMHSKDIEGMRLVIIRTAEGEISVLEDRCSHADVRISRGTLKDGVITCPAHGAKFDAVSGVQLCMPAVKPVRKFNYSIKEGIIFVDIPEVL